MTSGTTSVFYTVVVKEFIEPRMSPRVSAFECRVQAFIVVYTALPLLLLAVGFAGMGFFSVVFAGTYGLYFFGAMVVLVLFYAVLCLAIATALWARKTWAIGAAPVLSAMYLCLYQILNPDASLHRAHSFQPPGPPIIPLLPVLLRTAAVLNFLLLLDSTSILVRRK